MTSSTLRCSFIFIASVLAHHSIGSIAFQIQPTPTPVASSRTRLFKGGKLDLDSVTPEKIFASEGWPVVKAQLNNLPAFACANAEGQALFYDYRIGGSDDDDDDDAVRSVPMYFLDVAAAKKELEDTKKMRWEEREKKSNGDGDDDDDDSPVLDADADIDSFDILPYPLGEVFEEASLGHAMLLPSIRALEVAGAPGGTKAMGQQVPLFACMNVLEEVDGEPVLPLFMDPDEARAAIDEALEHDAVGGQNGEGVVGSAARPELTMDCLSLTKAVALLTTVAETPAFQFVPPASSIRHIREYLEDTRRDNDGTLGFR